MRQILSKISEISPFKKLFHFSLLFSGLLISSCSTLKPQYGKNVNMPQEPTGEMQKPAFTFYLIGDAGNADQPESLQTLSFLKSRLDKADSASALIFLGDNIYPKGMPGKKSDQRGIAEQKLQNQIDIQKDFKGQTFFIPGNHDWYSNLKGLNEQEEFVTAQLGKKSFLPRKGCAIDSKSLGNDITLITVDSQWYLEKLGPA